MEAVVNYSRPDTSNSSEIARINLAMRSGGATRKAIAKMAGVEYHYLCALIRDGSVTMRERIVVDGREMYVPERSNQEKLAEIRAGIRDGLSKNELMQRTNLRSNEIYYLSGFDGNIPTSLESIEYKLSAIKKRVARGAYFIPAFLNAFDVAPTTFQQAYLKEIPISKSQPTDRLHLQRLDHTLRNRGRPEMDRLIRRGLPFAQIAERCNVTRQLVEQYAEGSGQWNQWLLSRRNYATEKLEAKRRADAASKKLAKLRKDFHF